MFIEVTSIHDGNKILIPQYSNNLGVTVTNNITVIFVVSSPEDIYWQVKESYEKVKELLVPNGVTVGATNGD